MIAWQWFPLNLVDTEGNQSILLKRMYTTVIKNKIANNLMCYTIQTKAKTVFQNGRHFFHNDCYSSYATIWTYLTIVILNA